MPKLAAFNWELPHPDWIISSNEMMKRAGGVPIVIINNSNRTLVLSQIWLEWFAPLRVIPKGFQRGFVLRMRLGEPSQIYYQEVIELGTSPTVLKPKDSITWVLLWDNARSFDKEIRERFSIEPRQTVDMTVTVYDEYSDRVHDSREIVLFSWILRGLE